MEERLARLESQNPDWDLRGAAHSVQRYVALRSGGDSGGDSGAVIGGISSPGGGRGGGGGASPARWPGERLARRAESAGGERGREEQLGGLVAAAAWRGSLRRSPDADRRAPGAAWRGALSRSPSPPRCEYSQPHACSLEHEPRSTSHVAGLHAMHGTTRRRSSPGRWDWPAEPEHPRLLSATRAASASPPRRDQLQRRFDAPAISLAPQQVLWAPTQHAQHAQQQEAGELAVVGSSAPVASAGAAAGRVSVATVPQGGFVAVGRGGAGDATGGDGEEEGWPQGGGQAGGPVSQRETASQRAKLQALQRRRERMAQPRLTDAAGAPRVRNWNQRDGGGGGNA